jgi:single-strand DNA-binding protein
MRLFVLSGRLVKDPEQRTIGDKTLTEFSIAVEGAGPRNVEEGKTESGFFNCQAWGGAGDLVKKWFVKGSPITVSGNLVQDRWKDKETNEGRSTIKFVVNSVEFVPRDYSNQEGQKEAVGVGATTGTKEYDPFAD